MLSFRAGSAPAAMSCAQISVLPMDAASISGVLASYRPGVLTYAQTTVRRKAVSTRQVCCCARRARTDTAVVRSHTHIGLGGN